MQTVDALTGNGKKFKLKRGDGVGTKLICMEKRNSYTPPCLTLFLSLCLLRFRFDPSCVSAVVNNSGGRILSHASYMQQNQI